MDNSLSSMNWCFIVPNEIQQFVQSAQVCSGFEDRTEYYLTQKVAQFVMNFSYAISILISPSQQQLFTRASKPNWFAKIRWLPPIVKATTITFFAVQLNSRFSSALCKGVVSGIHHVCMRILLYSPPGGVKSFNGNSSFLQELKSAWLNSAKYDNLKPNQKSEIRFTAKCFGATVSLITSIFTTSYWGNHLIGNFVGYQLAAIAQVSCAVYVTAIYHFAYQN